MGAQTRRQFMKRASAASVIALSAEAATGAQESPNERISVGFVGVAGRAGSLLRMFAAQQDVDIVALADIDAGRLGSGIETVKQRKRRTPASYGDFRKLIDDPSIDALVVGTPDHWHAIPTIMACMAGKDVYVEKPDGHNMLEGKRMVEAMRKHDRIVQLGTQARTTPHFQSAIDFVRRGKLGRVLVAKSWESARQRSLGHPSDGTPPANVDYDMWLGAAPKRPFNPLRFHGNWRWFFDYGSGDLGNDGVHRLDVARWALSAAVEAQGGTPLTMPSKISAIGGKWYFDDAQEWPDTLQVNYEYAADEGNQAGRLLTYEMRIWTPYEYQGETEGAMLYGDQGYLVIGNRSWSAHAPDGERLAQGQGNNDGTEHIRNFLDCVKSRKRPNADLETVGHPSSVLCHAANVAWRTGQTLTLDPVTETFDNPRANEFLTRPEYRKPWLLPVV